MAKHARNLAPRLLNQQEAASYCGICVAVFKSACPVEPLLIAGRIQRWDRVALDRWIDGLSAGGKPAEMDLGAAWDAWQDKPKMKEPGRKR
jgi:hypothetical protein